MSVRTSVFASDIALRNPGGKRRTVGGWIHTIAYAVWLGGLIAIGAFVAPNVAAVIHNYPAFAGNKSAQDEILVNVIGNSFRTFNVGCYVSGGCMLLGDLLQAASAAPAYRRFTVARSFFTLLLIGSALYLGYWLFPHMDADRAANQMGIFDVLHKRYVLVSQLQLVPLVIIPLLTAQRDQAVDSQF